MANLNIDAVKERTFQAIVIGSGISGSWAAKELTEHGVKTLVIERGRDVKHIKDYPTTSMLPYEFEHRGQIPQDVQKENPVVSRCYAFREDAQHLTGFAAISWAVNPSFGPDRYNVGRITILRVRHGMDLRWIGQFATKISRHGTAMWRSLPEFRATKTACPTFLTGSFCPVFR
jgi:hypothetical protein